jgi:predicted TIM-barrel fold metal-dependent hydrolase
MPDIFDSNTHPIFENNSLQNCAAKLISDGINLALAHQLPSANPVENETYIKACTDTSVFIPVGTLLNLKDIESTFKEIKYCGGVAIKIHPRFLKWNWTDETETKRLLEIFKYSRIYNLPILWCTYYASTVSLLPQRDPIHVLTRALCDEPDVKLILMHAGGVELLKYIEFSRFNNNVLLDLSYTLSKFKKSSIWTDIIYALSDFDRRICFGSDYPYLDPSECYADLYTAIDAAGFDKNFHKIYKKNLLEFLELNI